VNTDIVPTETSVLLLCRKSIAGRIGPQHLAGANKHGTQCSAGRFWAEKLSTG
jgi:hypothetical protein